MHLSTNTKSCDLRAAICELRSASHLQTQHQRMTLPVIAITDKRLSVALAFLLAIEVALMGCILDESEFARLHCVMGSSSVIFSKTTAFQICLQNTETLNAIESVLDFNWKFENVCLVVATGSHSIAWVSNVILEEGDSLCRGHSTFGSSLTKACLESRGKCCGLLASHCIKSKMKLTKSETGSMSEIA